MGGGWGGVVFRSRDSPRTAKISSSKPCSPPSALKPLPAPAYPSNGDVLNEILSSSPLSAGWWLCCHCHGLTLWLQIPLGLGTAASVQVGNALGAGDVETAKRSSSTSLLCTGRGAARSARGTALRLRSPAPLSLQLLPRSLSQPGWAQRLALFSRSVLHSRGGRFSRDEGRAGVHLHQ